MLIRHATAADVAAVMELERQASTAAHWSEEQYARLFATADAPSQRLALVILTSVIEQATAKNLTKGGEKVSAVRGFLVARGLGVEWELENLVVETAARRQGLGKRLVDELIAHAQAAGARSAFLEVRESNQAARALYESVGFVVNGRRKDYYAAPSDDAILYRRSLR